MLALPQFAELWLVAYGAEAVPSERTDALRQGARNIVFDRTILNAGHNDIYARSAFQAAMDDALRCIET